MSEPDSVNFKRRSVIFNVMLQPKVCLYIGGAEDLRGLQGGNDGRGEGHGRQGSSDLQHHPHLILPAAASHILFYSRLFIRIIRAVILPWCGEKSSIWLF